MYTLGHVGIALALYAPIGLGLLTRGRARLAVAGTVVVTSTTMLPDVDQWLPPLVHRGITHSVWFALAFGVTLGVVAAILAGYRYRSSEAMLVFGAFGLTVGVLAILAHLLGDVLTPMGIRPFYPLFDVHYTLDLVYARDPTANSRLFAFGCLVTVAQLLLGTAEDRTTSKRRTVRGTLNGAARYVVYGTRDTLIGSR